MLYPSCLSSPYIAGQDASLCPVSLAGLARSRAAHGTAQKGVMGTNALACLESSVS